MALALVALGRRCVGAVEAGHRGYGRGHGRLTPGGTGAHRAIVPPVLDLLRHGAALPATHGGDEARRLSPRGRADLERLAMHLAGRGWRPDRAFASPLVRARDSATIVVRAAAPGLTVELMDALLPETDPAALLDALAAETSTGGHVFLVGHQPLLGLLVGLLVGGPGHGFAPGCLVRIEFTAALAARAGVVGWHLAPGFSG